MKDDDENKNKNKNKKNLRARINTRTATTTATARRLCVRAAVEEKEIESERVLLQFVIIESCSRTNGVREAYVPNWFELKNITRARLK